MSDLGITNSKDYPSGKGKARGDEKTSGGPKLPPRSAEYAQVTNSKDYPRSGGTHSTGSWHDRTVSHGGGPKLPPRSGEYAQVTNSKGYSSKAHKKVSKEEPGVNLKHTPKVL